LAKALDQQFDSRCIIFVCNVISLVTYMPRMNYVGGVQTIISIPKLGPLPKVHNRHNKDPIVKLEPFGHNSLECCAYFSSP
jgi:hypothetical protein